MDWTAHRDRILALSADTPRYELIAQCIEDMIENGRLQAGQRLPTVRRLAADLGVSTTTTAAAYSLLQDRGLIRSEVGRGSFVSRPFASGVLNDNLRPVAPPRSPSTPWRRRALKTAAARLRQAHPAALDCTSGRPDAALLPLEVLQRAWQAAIAETEHSDLQYASGEPVEALAREVLPRLEADGIPARKSDLVVGTSAQQLMVLALQVGEALSAGPGLNVGVEQPGYPTILDTFDRAGCRQLGMEVDAEGVLPASLYAALEAGAQIVLFTPRAHNPTGASWTPERAAALADVLADFPKTLVIEDDQFAGVATARPGSLLADRRIEDRVLYVRTFSKAIAPDLRIAVAAARPSVRALLAEAKTFADGWTSRLGQRALAHALADPALDEALAHAGQAYAERRDALVRGSEGLARAGGEFFAATDGVNVWLGLPPGLDSSEVVEFAAQSGLLISSGEPFFLWPGRSDLVRLSIGAVDTAQAAEAGRILSKASTMVSRAHVSAAPI